MKTARNIVETNPRLHGFMSLPATELSPVDVSRAVEVLRGAKIGVLTGAGISTDSGIPDYRGKGSRTRTPMTIDEFVSSPTARERYWLRAHRGWPTFAHAIPNSGHNAVVALEQAGFVSGVITQNVDNLHRQAGTKHVIELHGTLGTVLCLSCRQEFGRDDIETRLENLNPWLSEVPALDPAELAPDGDANVELTGRVVVPECTVCGGILKPNVVFFGEFVPQKQFVAAADLVKRADALLIAGSSLAVNSGLRLVEVARRKKIPIVIINRGATKADRLATYKFDAGTSEVLSELALGLGAHDVYEDIE